MEINNMNKNIIEENRTVKCGDTFCTTKKLSCMVDVGYSYKPIRCKLNGTVVVVSSNHIWIEDSEGIRYRLTPHTYNNFNSL